MANTNIHWLQVTGIYIRWVSWLTVVAAGDWLQVTGIYIIFIRRLRRLF